MIIVLVATCFGEFLQQPLSHVNAETAGPGALVALLTLEEPVDASPENIARLTRRLIKAPLAQKPFGGVSQEEKYH